MSDSARLILLTTSIFADAPSVVLQRMLAAASRAAAAGVQLRQLLLLQNTTDEIVLAAQDWPAFVTVLTRPDIMSLSAARNILLDEARQAGLLTAQNVVAYPDDDSWYPDGVPDCIMGAFAETSELDFAFTRYGSSPALTTPLPRRPARAADVVRNASSNTLFLRGSLVARIGNFNPELGVGTANNGGEDLEYGLRAYRAARRSTFIPAVLVGHRDKNSALRAKYYRGSLMSLRRHSVHPGINAQYLRKLAIGVALVMRRELSAGDLLSAVKARLSPSDGSTFPQDAAGGRA